MKISKYFWDFNEKALKETSDILKNPKHSKFVMRMVTLLSRCDQPKELFSLISKEDFVKTWPKIRAYWIRLARESEFRDWWETICEQFQEDYRLEQKKQKGKPFDLFLKIGQTIKKKRIDKGLSQNELAFRVGMKQPDISGIEEGKKNVTLETLASLCKALGIKKVDL